MSVRFVVTGPESSGKTTLAVALAEKMQMNFVQEHARAHLTLQRQVRPGYLPSDLLAIAGAQSAAEQGERWIADTDLQNIYLWWQEKFGPAPASLVRSYAMQSARTYLLCRPDFSWEFDPLRENPHDRDRLFQIYLADLRTRELPYHVIEGSQQTRFEMAGQILEEQLDLQL